MAKKGMGELEAAVMEVLWDAGDARTPRQVHDVMNETTALAYTTVMTVLVRLWQKGRVEREAQGRAFAYRATQGREEYAAARMAEVLIGAKDRPAALSYFVAGLKASDRTRLRRLLGKG